MSVQGVASTKGHLAGNGGLRGHSVGVFPCVIFQKGVNSPEYWVLQPNGGGWPSPVVHGCNAIG